MRARTRSFGWVLDGRPGIRHWYVTERMELAEGLEPPTL
jgi:hypothetical protein